MKKSTTLLISVAIFLTIFCSKVYSAEYVAFSMKVAQERILSTPQGKDFRKVHPEVFALGGITKIRGLVYDRKNKDIILVGQRDPERAILTLDDFVVALRARFIHGKWPLVSIDPIPETEKSQMQAVRFEGGIEDTQFGQDLFDADYRLKRIGMGIVSPGVQGLKTYWDISMERAKEQARGSHKIGSRFWFYPVLPGVSVREDVVAIKGLKVGVFTEVLSAEIDGKKVEDLSTFQDVAGDEFARVVSDNFESLTKVHPSFARLQGLDELVALTRAIEEMEEKPDLNWWIKDYVVKELRTKRKVKVLERKEDYEIPVSGGVYKGYYEVSGGVRLMAIALRIKAGDVTALKEAVLVTRPKADQLAWTFAVKDWGIAGARGGADASAIAELRAHGEFLFYKKRYREAVTLFSRIIKLNPHDADAWNNRGAALAALGDYQKAMISCNKALESHPKHSGAWSNKGMILDCLGRSHEAINCFDKSLNINSLDARVCLNKGTALGHLSRYEEAIEYYNRALELNPMFSEAWSDKGTALYGLMKHQEALTCLNKALQINPTDYMAWYNKGNVLYYLKHYEDAKKCWEKTIELDPNSEAGRNASEYIIFLLGGE